MATSWQLIMAISELHLNVLTKTQTPFQEVVQTQMVLYSIMLKLAAMECHVLHMTLRKS